MDVCLKATEISMGETTAGMKSSGFFGEPKLGHGMDPFQCSKLQHVRRDDFTYSSVL